MRLRATIRVRNDALLRARKARGWTQAYLAEVAEVPLGLVQSLERLNYTRQDTRWGAQRLAWTLEIDLVEILPDELVGLDLEVKEVFVREVSSEQLIDSHARRGLLQAPPDEIVAEHEAIEKALDLLDSRLRRALEIRYGLCGNPPHTFEEAGKVLNVTRERARQIICKAERQFRDLYPTLTEKTGGKRMTFGEKPYYCLVCQKTVFHARPGQNTRYKTWKHNNTKTHKRMKEAQENRGRTTKGEPE